MRVFCSEEGDASGGHRLTDPVGTRQVCQTALDLRRVHDGQLAVAVGVGTVTIVDARAIQRHLARYTVSHPRITVMCGDVDGNGLDIMDATRIQRCLAQYADPYGIGEPIE